MMGSKERDLSMIATVCFDASIDAGGANTGDVNAVKLFR